MGHKFAPRCVTDERRALGHAIAHGEGEVYLHQEVLYLGIERRSAYNKFFELATEGVDEFFAYLVVNLGVEERNIECPTHHSLADEWHYLLAIYLLEHQWHRHHEVGLHFLHCLYQYLGRWYAAEQIDVCAHTKWHQKVESTTISVCQWQERQVAGAAIVQSRCYTIHGIAGDIGAGNHYALAIAGGARRVVEYHHAIVIDVVVFDVFFGKSCRIGFLEQSVG